MRGGKRLCYHCNELFLENHFPHTSNKHECLFCWEERTGKRKRQLRSSLGILDSLDGDGLSLFADGGLTITDRTCPHCQSDSMVQSKGLAPNGKGRRFKCSGCSKSFTVSNVGGVSGRQQEAIRINSSSRLCPSCQKETGAKAGRNRLGEQRFKCSDKKCAQNWVSAITISPPSQKVKKKKRKKETSRLSGEEILRRKELACKFESVKSIGGYISFTYNDKYYNRISSADYVVKEKKDGTSYVSMKADGGRWYSFNLLKMSDVQ